MIMKRLILAALLWVAMVAPSPAQFSDQMTWGGTGAGSANAQTVTISNVSALADLVGVSIRFSPGATNTSATTLAVSGLTATAIRKWSPAGLVALTGGELRSGVPVDVMYNGTFIILLSPTMVQPLSTRQVLTSGTGATYNTGVSGGQTARQLRFRMIGAGGGGGANNSQNGSAGTATVFNSIAANPGDGGLTGSGTGGGAGGTGGAGSADLRIAGGTGSAPSTTQNNVLGGAGCFSPFGGGGGGNLGLQAGRAGASNSGAGGSGAGSATTTPGSGGGCGEYVEFHIDNPSASYTYTVGAGGAGGVGTNNGAAGGSGLIIVDEFYLHCMRAVSELMPANDNDEEERRCAA